MCNPFVDFELLAPAGSMDALHAAVAAGADAIYLGLDEFNDRRGADNFTLENLGEACDYAHVRGVSIYLTMNIVILQEEIYRAIDMVKKAWLLGIDAVIVQDIGLASEIARVLPNLEMHVSTQANTLDVEGIRAASALGCKRITFAREVTLGEISSLSAYAHDLDMQTEVFGHGAICVCYSGQCFMSSMIGGRSANRGTCAQACRLPYKMETEDDSHTKVQGNHLLSPKDLATIEILGSLVATGANSIKIEGRMKSADYVFTVVHIYREVLNRMRVHFDELIAQGVSDIDISSFDTDAACMPTDEERRALEEVFSRGFTTAYLLGDRGNNMMSYQQPNNRGMFIGRIRRLEGNRAYIDAQLELFPGDIVQVYTKKGNESARIEPDAHQGDTTYICTFENPVSKGDRVFRVRSAALSYDAAAHDDKLAVEAKVRVQVGHPLAIEVSCADITTSFEGQIVEEARTKPLEYDDIYEHIDRTGGTDFAFSHIDIVCDSNAGMGFSALHKARSQALKLLSDALLQPWRTRKSAEESQRKAVSSSIPAWLDEYRAVVHEARQHARELEKKQKGHVDAKKKKNKKSKQGKHESSESLKKVVKPRPVLAQTCGATEEDIMVVAFASNPQCARIAKRAGAQDVYVSTLNYKRGSATLAGNLQTQEQQAGYPSSKIAALPVVDKAPLNRDEPVDMWKYATPDKPLFVETFGQLVRASEEGMVPEVGPHIPINNVWSLDVAAAFGARRIWLSPELSLQQIRAIGQHSPVPLGITISGYQELMTTEHCLLMSEGPCDQKCSSCERRLTKHALKDRMGYSFQIVTDQAGRSHLYNSVMLDTNHVMAQLIEAGVTAFMVDTTLMDEQETSEAVAKAVCTRNMILHNGIVPEKQKGATTGHLFRPIE